MNNNIAKARREYVERSGNKFTQEDAAKFVGVSVTAYRNWEQQKNLPDAKNAIFLAKKYRVSIDYLLGISSVDTPMQAYTFMGVPLYGADKEGSSLDMFHITESKTAPMNYLKDDPDCFYVQVCGNAMSHIMQAGDFALVSPKQTIPNEEDAFLVAVGGRETLISKLHKLENGIELVPDSYDPTFRPRIIDFGSENAANVKIIGKIVWHCAAF